MIEWAERNDGQIFLALTALLLALSGLGWEPGQTAILLVLACGVAVLGLPHGSLDLLVARRLMRTNALTATLIFALIYLSVAAVYGLVWWWSASIGLTSFLLISAVHFGSDWQDRTSSIMRFAYGLSVVTLPALRHGSEVAAIYAILGAGAAVSAQLVAVSQVAAILALLTALAGSAFGSRRRDLAEFAGIAAAALLLPPLMYFGLYFCWLHSPRHLLRTARDLHLRTPTAIIRNVSVATLAPLAAAFLIFERRHSVPVTTELTRLTFIGLAALTVPHMSLHAVEKSLRGDRSRR